MCHWRMNRMLRKLLYLFSMESRKEEKRREVYRKQKASLRIMYSIDDLQN